METIELFTKACIDYGMHPLDVFQVADLYETKAMFSVRKGVKLFLELWPWKYSKKIFFIIRRTLSIKLLTVHDKISLKMITMGNN